MRRTVSLLAALFLLALPAAASAHYDWRSVTITPNPSGYFEDIAGYIGVADPACGSYETLGPNDVKYIVREDGHFGIGGFVDWNNIHPAEDDFTIPAQNLRQWTHPVNSSSGHVLGARYNIDLYLPAPYNTHLDVVRFRNSSPSLTWTVRRNC